MKIILIVDDVDPAQAGELMEIIEASMESRAGWLRNREYTLGALDTDCHPVERD